MAVWDRLWLDGSLATFRPGADPLGAIPDGAVGVAAGRIAWVGRRRELPAEPDALAREIRSMEGGWMTPGLIDCHTHLIFGGDRSGEFELRVREGASYEEIAAAGGGILSTVRATRAASEEVLLERALTRLEVLLSEGITTVEIKSGYGLDRDTELGMLRVAGQLAGRGPVHVHRTFLGAHALAPEFEKDREGYLGLVVDELIPEIAAGGLADSVDAFCEPIAFSSSECERVLRRGMEHGLSARLHADQLSDSGGATLAGRLGANSADHLEHASEEGIREMARAGTAAVLLPGAFYFLPGGARPDVEALRRHHVRIALATDLNPGSSPLLSLLIAVGMGVHLFGLTPDEALAGVTREAAHALGLGHDRGTIEPGKRADLAIWNVVHPRELAYWIGARPLRERVLDGEPHPA